MAPASPSYDPLEVELGKYLLEELGFQVAVAPNALKKNRYLAGTDTERLSDLRHMFLEPAIDGLLCLRGGYGCMRLLSQIDYRVVRNNPKILVGYSDITALQLAIWKHAGLVTFSGPMLVSDFGRGAGAYTINHFYKALTSPFTLGVIPPAPDTRCEVIRPGRASGRLLGGNLTLIAATLGTPYEIDTRGAILFLEDVDEQPYRVDRMLQQLRLAGKFRFVAGVVFGEFAGCEAEENTSSFSLLEVLKDAMKDTAVPCYYGLATGHGVNKATLPLGVKAEIDAAECILTITESATII
ncbi:S66 peptidase family protein [Pelotomaculum schinkii]|uniref:S66 peptidase family protein n=1 Tax=Pelotomaculum schinkii TaxID=78350 RepID=UPI00249EC36C|nr:LD-carboxypeptidase [Pelotomaculum schinkii]